MSNRKLDVYTIEYTRIDEQSIHSYQVALEVGEPETLARAKADEQFMSQYPDSTIATHEQVVDPSFRARADAKTTYWCNRAKISGEVIF